MIRRAKTLLFKNIYLSIISLDVLVNLILGIVYCFISGGFTYITKHLGLFLTVNITFLLVLAIVYAFKNRLYQYSHLKKIGKKATKAINKSYKYSKQTAISTYQNIQYKYDVTKQNLDINQLSLYLLVGKSGDGITSWIKNSGVALLDHNNIPKQLQKIIKTFPQYDFYISQTSIFINVKSIYDADINTINDLLKYCKKRKKKKPISGIIAFYPAINLMVDKHDDRRVTLQYFANVINHIAKYLSTKIPVYSVLTKTDQINGFVDYFHHFSKDDLAQLLGITFPVQHCNDLYKNEKYLDITYDSLIKRLDNQIISVISGEKTLAVNSRVYNFPQQMSLLKASLKTYLKELFSGLVTSKYIQFRGFYFTSAIQTYQSIDFIATAINNKLALGVKAESQKIESDESYFIYDLINKVISPEGRYLGYSNKALRMKKINARLFSILLPVLFLLIAFMFHFTYMKSYKMNQTVQSDMSTYQQDKKQLDINQYQLSSQLPSLSLLKDDEQKVSDMSLIYWLFIPNHYFYHEINHALNRQLENEFLPRVAVTLENILDNNLDINNLYAALKGYLVFSPNFDMKNNSITAPLAIQLRKEGLSDQKVKALSYYINRSTKLNVIPLPVDKNLIENKQKQLQTVIPSQRAYALLNIKSLSTNNPEMQLESLCGEDCSDVFAISKMNIPSLYTKSGYSNIFKTNYLNIAKTVSSDNQDIGLLDDQQRSESLDNIVKDIENTYSQKYISYWNKQLNNINIVKINSFNQLISIYHLLNGLHSPLAQLLTILDENLSGINNQQLKINSHYQSLTTAIDPDNLVKIQKNITGINHILNKINKAPNKALASWQFLKSFAKQSDNNPLTHLKVLANNQPQPIKRWLNQLLSQTWQIIANEALLQINKNWQQSYQYYQQHFNNHFPFVGSSDDNVTLNDFVEYYNRQGLFEKFYKTNLQNYVQFINNQIQLKSLHQFTLPLDKQTIHLLTRNMRIMNDYFNIKNQLNINMQLKANSLDANAASFTLTFGNQHFSYYHGPQVITTINWPAKDNQNNTSLSLIDLNNNNALIQFSGPWSLLKLLSKATIKSNQKQHVLYYSLNNYPFSFVLYSDAPLSAITLQDMNKLIFPKQLQLSKEG